MNILSSNSKTGFSINFPIEQTCDKTCPFYQDRTCYGLKGRFIFGSVKRANEARYELYKNSPLIYFNRLSSEIAKKRSLTHLRINGVGDTPNRAWATSFSDMARKFPQIQFWVSTRKTFWELIELPANVTVRYSDGVIGDLRSEVVLRADQASCPATRKDSGIHNCSQCGFKCYDKDIPNVSFLKH